MRSASPVPADPTASRARVTAAGGPASGARRTTRCRTARAEVGVGPWEGPLARRAALRPGAAGATATAATWSTATATGASRRSWPTSTPAATTSTWPIENWQHDFNIGTIVRTANAFLAAEVHIVGRRRWNRRGAMVTDRYQHVRHHPTVADLAAYLHARGGRPLIGDRQPAGLAAPRDAGAAPPGLLPVRPGGPGALRRGRGRSATATFSIAQFGSTRSINASRRRRDRDALLGARARRPRRAGRLARLTARGAQPRVRV